VSTSPERRGTLPWLLTALAVAVGGGVSVAVWLTQRTRRQPLSNYPHPDDLLTDPVVDARVVRHSNGGLTVRWYANAETIIVYGGTSTDAINTDEPLAVTSDVSSVTFNHLDLSQRHIFQIQFVGGPHDGQTLIVAERDVALEGGVNFRDIGGYKTHDGRYTRWGQVYRSGGLEQLTDGDIARLESMDLQTACDLRTDDEVAEAPDKLPGNVEYVHLPVRTSESRSQQIRSLLRYRNRMDAAMIDAYTRLIVDNNPNVFAGVIRRVADTEQLPLLVHCTAGKDRTGVAMALLLSLLGVPDETILADYSLSNAHFAVFEAYGAKAIQPLVRFGITTATMQPVFTANPATIAATLQHVRDRYGSVEDYLVSMGGLTPDELDRVRDNLLTAP
jgi:protein-tyrosine phosphatase